MGVAPTARRRLRHSSVDESVVLATPTTPIGWWMTLRQQTVAADATRQVSSEYVTRLPRLQQSLCERFSLICLDPSTSGDASGTEGSNDHEGGLRDRVKGLGLKEMTDFALAAPFLLTSKWSAFTEMVLKLGIVKDGFLKRCACLFQELAPFFPMRISDVATEAAPKRRHSIPPFSLVAQRRTTSGQLAKRERQQAMHKAAETPPVPPPREYSRITAMAADAAVATAAAAAAEGTADGIDMRLVRRKWTELQELAEEERQLAVTYLALAAEQNLFSSVPDDSLWEALLQQVVLKATAAVAAARSGLTATYPDLHHEGTDGYQTAFSTLAAADERIRLLLAQQQDIYAGSQPVLFFVRGILLSICEPGECNGAR
ncbi:hypothetical protein, conserved [Eimeria acervulina]|uniref:Uncharacterized protein n=1 Tax=Eimeria acervulina TaxID=5801 RepID=U6GCZ4_EIMAC|nr:hypothetical protein, conserved [Eimeria acervulina]CDI77203.1 hypothetical protein, conserved [Eimeria acervulina]